MSIISKDLARQIAKKLTQKKYDALTKTKKELSDYAYEIAKSTIKKDVFDFYLKNKMYFKTSTSITFVGPGLNHENVHINEIPSNGSWNVTKLASDKEAKSIVEFLNSIKTQKKQINELFLEIESALLGLKTYARITENFKEASKYLPIKENKEISINVSQIIKKLL